MRKNVLLPALLFFPVPATFIIFALAALTCHFFAGGVLVSKTAFNSALAASCCVSGASAVAIGVSAFRKTRRFGDLLKGIGIAAVATFAAALFILPVL